jgi:hypothetical protein
MDVLYSRGSEMAYFLKLVGWIVIFLGIISGVIIISEDIIMGISLTFGSVLSGVLYLAIGIVIDSLNNIEAKLFGNYKMYNDLFDDEIEYKFHSELFNVNESERDTYPLIELNGNQYTRAKVFKNYVSYTGDRFTFEFPNMEPISMRKEKSYSSEAGLFENNGVLYVKLSNLSIKAEKQDKVVVLTKL